MFWNTEKCIWGVFGVFDFSSANVLYDTTDGWDLWPIMQPATREWSTCFGKPSCHTALDLSFIQNPSNTILWGHPHCFQCFKHPQTFVSGLQNYNKPEHFALYHNDNKCKQTILKRWHSTAETKYIVQYHYYCQQKEGK